MSELAFAQGARVVADGALGVAEAQYAPGLSVLVRFDNMTRAYVLARRVAPAPADAPPAPERWAPKPRKHAGLIGGFSHAYLEGDAEVEVEAVRAASDRRAMESQGQARALRSAERQPRAETKVDRILAVLPATSKEIRAATGFGASMVSTYLNNLKHDGRVVKGEGYPATWRRKGQAA